MLSPRVLRSSTPGSDATTNPGRPNKVDYSRVLSHFHQFSRCQEGSGRGKGEEVRLIGGVLEHLLTGGYLH